MPADNDLYTYYVTEIASPQYAFIYNPTNRKKTKTYGLEGLYTSLRQGRSLPLPTLPFQRTNRYAVVDIANCSYPELIPSFIRMRHMIRCLLSTIR